ncbi:hypothetical protein [Methylocapsa sp. S129]|uniref:hypothetical protein n=1 Tax=Methylocapsa sp. S129 TaxID=1641869 RepID=UPI00131AF919|nr:hypothetical protein [Methylocapsa sp. S129]
MSDSPIIAFTSISGANVFATYANLPPSSRIVFVNQTSGKPFDGGGIDASGGASVTMPLPAGMPAGAYYLKAQDSTGAYLAQSVVFYVDAATGPTSA